MEGEQGKLFIGGISWETTEEKLMDYFGNYGDVVQANIMREKCSGRPRGFGFVHFSNPMAIDKVLQDKHTLDGRVVEAKRAMSKEDQQNTTRSGKTGNNSGRNGGVGGNTKTKKIFVGGLPPSLTDEGFRQYFKSFGHVTDVVIMYDQSTQRPRGFGFVSFDSEDAVDRVLQNTFHDLDGKQVEVKRALPKDASLGIVSRGYQNSYGSRMDSNRYMQPQNNGAGFPPYGASGYGAAGYGYGPVNGGVGYGGYAAYGNVNAPSAGYGSGPAGAPRSLWNAQAASGYGSSGYGNAPAWGAVGASSAGPTSQSLGRASGYRSQGYGYGSNTSGGYNDANVHGGYASSAHMGYGGGYGVGQNRQV
ncbi:hypothetical protein RND81_12G136000 [Saponaria officinalis]|uniref:RRM domain-containing protein n=1 Tax=Saponaria officinalis TaxID=3572 RepID=A0AAW1HA72_SAPOF